MFVDTDDNFIEKIDRIMASEDDVRKNFFKFMLSLSYDDVVALERIMNSAIDFFQDTKENGD